MVGLRQLEPLFPYAHVILPLPRGGIQLNRTAKHGWLAVPAAKLY